MAKRRKIAGDSSDLSCVAGDSARIDKGSSGYETVVRRSGL
jgi:hypothetical protein